MKKVVFTFGRINPPTIGHQKLVDKVTSLARKEKADAKVYLSHTQNNKKDPLDYNSKYTIAAKAFGKVVTKSTARQPVDILKELEKQGYTDVIMVVGSDRVSSMSFIQKYNGKEYNFNSIEIVSAGERDPDAEGVEGMSASKMRALAKEGNFAEFKKGLPPKVKADAKKIFDQLRSIMEQADAEEQLDEYAVLNQQQRMKRARMMKRIAKKVARMRKIRAKRMADTNRLMKRSRKQAIQFLRKRVAGQRGAEYSKLGRAEKITVDKLVSKKSALIDRMAKRLLPKVRKAEVARVTAARQGPKNEEIKLNSYKQLIEVKQDPEIKDREGAQPAKYHSGLSKSTKEKRDAQFQKGAEKSHKDPSAYPEKHAGDTGAKTRTSKHTKKYHDMFGEGRSRGPNEVRTLNNIEREKQNDLVKHDRMRDQARLKDTLLRNKGVTKEEYELTEDSKAALMKKADKSGIPYSILKKVYDRGMAAWRTGHRPGAGQEQWAYARVNSFITKGKGTWGGADKDLAAKVKKESVELDEAKKQKPFMVFSPSSYRSHQILGKYKTKAEAEKALSDFQKHMPKGHKPLEIRMNEGGEAADFDMDPEDMAKRKSPEAPTYYQRGGAKTFKDMPKLKTFDENPPRGLIKAGDEVNEAPRWLGIPVGKAINKKKYEKAKEILQGVLDRKKKEGKLKHDVVYYASQIAKQFSGVDARALAAMVEQVDEACWKGYKQEGMKKKGEKVVPNCVPEAKNPAQQAAIAIAKKEKLQEGVKHEDGKWVIYSPDGLKILGKYDSEEQARKQWDQIKAVHREEVEEGVGAVAKTFANMLSRRSMKGKKVEPVDKPRTDMSDKFTKSTPEDSPVYKKPMKPVNEEQIDEIGIGVVGRYLAKRIGQSLTKKAGETSKKSIDTQIQNTANAKKRIDQHYGGKPQLVQSPAPQKPSGTVKSIQTTSSKRPMPASTRNPANEQVEVDEGIGKLLAKGLTTKTGRKIVKNVAKFSIPAALGYGVATKVPSVKPAPADTAKSTEVKKVDDKEKKFTKEEADVKSISDANHEKKKKLKDILPKSGAGEWGTDELTKTYKKDTPGQSESLDENFSAFYTAKDLGIEMQGGFAYHPSVEEAMKEQQVDEIGVGTAARYLMKRLTKTNSAARQGPPKPEDAITKKSTETIQKNTDNAVKRVYKEEVEQIDENPLLGLAARGAAAGLSKLGKSKWWNKGRNERIPNENQASVKTLAKDDISQMTRSDKAFKSGSKKLTDLRPLKAFSPSMVKTGPSPAIRQAVERPLRSISRLGEAFEYHIENELSLKENVYRPHSEEYYNFFCEARRLWTEGAIELNDPFDIMLMESDAGLMGMYEGQEVPLDIPLLEESDKDVELNKPKRGGKKKFYVYVKNDKGNVVKVQFGDTTGLKAKIDNPEARKSFVARHNCSQKNDKTKPGYWACRLPYYAKELGLEGGGSFFW